MLKKDFGGNKVIASDWSLCMACEFELWMEAIRLILEHVPQSMLTVRQLIVATFMAW